MKFSTKHYRAQAATDQFSGPEIHLGCDLCKQVFRIFEYDISLHMIEGVAKAHHRAEHEHQSE